MCTICGDDDHIAGTTRSDFLKTGSMAALAPWMMGQAFAAAPPKPGDLFVVRVAGNVVARTCSRRLSTACSFSAYRWSP